MARRICARRSRGISQKDRLPSLDDTILEFAHECETQRDKRTDKTRTFYHGVIVVIILIVPMTRRVTREK